MQLDQHQLEAVVVELVRREPWVPHTKLLKMLFEVDFDYFEAHLRYLTGARYVAMNYGPLLDHYKQLLKPIVAGFFIVTATPGYNGKSYQLRGAPKCQLSADALEIVERVVQRNYLKSSAQMVEELHFDSAWRVVWKGFRGEKIPYSLAAQRPDYPERPAGQPKIQAVLEDTVSKGLIVYDQLAAADNIARELGKWGSPVDVEVDSDWVGLFVSNQNSMELEVAVAHDRDRNWRVFFSADSGNQSWSGIVQRVQGLHDLNAWLHGNSGWNDKNLEVGTPSIAIRA